MITLSQLLASTGKSLMFTLSAELILALLLKADKKTVAICTLVNIVTNPLVTLTFNWTYILTHKPPVWYIIITVEVLAVLTEAFVYGKTVKDNIRHPFLFSLILNLGSYLGGLAL
ncbi:MAG: hypothetical protein IJA55_06975 [Clostridia bacterium]|nr:hypothetical protein [Clostridia bacterium]